MQNALDTNLMEDQTRFGGEFARMIFLSMQVLHFSESP